MLLQGPWAAVYQGSGALPMALQQSPPEGPWAAGYQRGTRAHQGQAAEQQAPRCPIAAMLPDALPDPQATGANIPQNFCQNIVRIWCEFTQEYSQQNPPEGPWAAAGPLGSRVSG